jgi:MFS family permease
LQLNEKAIAPGHFLTVFIDLIGFGIVLPLLPIYSRNFGASGFAIGSIMASYSLMQFLFAPAWGRLSDRIGRRPVLLVSIAGSVISYAIFALGSGLEGRGAALLVLVVSRVLAGFAGRISRWHRRISRISQNRKIAPKGWD